MARTYEGPQDRDGRRLIGGAAIVFAAPASSVYVALLFLAVSYASLAIRRERNLVAAWRHRAELAARRVDRRYPPARSNTEGPTRQLPAPA
ncbi:MAG: hypothetical protein QOI36_6201 [Pseudonocardiales bacterium]|jgi:hypothetical protein|nr:hypothetical protein [Pseudonocardiales bacterium]